MSGATTKRRDSQAGERVSYKTAKVKGLDIFFWNPLKAGVFDPSVIARILNDDAV